LIFVAYAGFCDCVSRVKSCANFHDEQCFRVTDSHRQSQTITDLQQSQSNSIAGIMTGAGIKPNYRYPAWLWLTGCHAFSMALIEIDGLPNLKMGGSFRGKLLVITRWYNQMIIDWCDAPIVRAIAGIKPYLIGGLEHFLFSISSMGCHPSHWLHHFSEG
jgi:hypothetical protein